MKSKTLLHMVLIAAFYAICSSVNAQTFQFNLHGVCENAMILCVANTTTVSGEFTYHFTYHLNNKGELEWIHWNVIDYRLVNDNNNEEYYILKDTGRDNCNYAITWDIMGNLNAYNEGYGISYDKPDGFLEPYYPEVMPDEGTSIDRLTIRAAKGGKLIGVYNVQFQFHRNSKGEITADVEKTFLECY